MDTPCPHETANPTPPVVEEINKQDAYTKLKACRRGEKKNDYSFVVIGIAQGIHQGDRQQNVGNQGFHVRDALWGNQTYPFAKNTDKQQNNYRQNGAQNFRAYSPPQAFAFSRTKRCPFQ